jgi:uncharacterized membrane protein HdeD (DUF308 family)
MDKEMFTVGWKVLVVRGVLGIVLGIVAIAWPSSTASAFMVLWGIWAVVEGIGSLVQAVRPASEGNRVASALLGIVALVAGFFAVFSPQVSVETVTWIIGIWLVVRGLFEAVAAFTSFSFTPRWMLLLSAAFSVLLGVFFAANPGRAAVGIAVLLGIMALAWGTVFVIAGLVLRGKLETAATARPGEGLPQS